MKFSRVILAVMVLGLGSPSARAKIVFETEAAMAVRLSGSIDRIGKAMELSDLDAGAVREAALTWFYLGPCKGKDVPAQGAANAIGMASGGLLGPKPTMAMHAMIGMLAAESNLGREPGELHCKVIRDLAIPLQPAR